MSIVENLFVFVRRTLRIYVRSVPGTYLLDLFRNLVNEKGEKNY
jgi:hypothetical protein